MVRVGAVGEQGAIRQGRRLAGSGLRTGEIAIVS